MEIAAAAAVGVVGAIATQYKLTYYPPPPTDSAVFITGCDSGIGRATAIQLHKSGFIVFVGVLSQSNGDGLLKEIKNKKETFIPIVCDVTKENDIENAFNKISSHPIVKEKGLWGIVNNAGISACNAPVEFLPMHRLRRTMEVNLFAIFSVLQRFLPLIRKAKGRIVNISSVNGFFVWTNHAAYGASKHGVVALSDSLRLELYDLGIPVSVIQPGAINTEIFGESLKELERTINEMDPKHKEIYGDFDFEAAKKSLADQSKFGLLSPPSVIADAIQHALTSSHPKQVYRAGRGAGTFRFLKTHLPDSWFTLFIHYAIDREVNPLKSRSNL